MKLPDKKVLLTSSAVAMALGLLPMMASAEYRTFTSADGKTMNAELVSATDSTVTVKMEQNRRQVEFPMTLLAAEDQEFVKQWAKENQSYSLKIEARKKTTGSENKKEGNTTTNIRSYVYGVSINNWGRTQLEGAEIKYRIYMEDGSFNEGAQEVAMLKPMDTVAFQSDGISLQRCETKSISGGG